MDQLSVISIFQRISFRNDKLLFLADRHILTSAHCIENEEMVTVQIGAPDENQYMLSGIAIPHPDYDTWSSVNDIALIELQDSIEFGSKSFKNILSSKIDSLGLEQDWHNQFVFPMKTIMKIKLSFKVDLTPTPVLPFGEPRIVMI